MMAARHRSRYFVLSTVLIIVALYIISLLLFPIGVPEHSDRVSELIENTKHMTFMGINEEVNWREVLQTKKIKHIERMETESSDLVEKYLILLEDDFLAVGKLAQPLNPIPYEYTTYSFQSGLLSDKLMIKRADRWLQGAGELAGSAVASLLFPGSKPPVVQRTISSEKLLICAGCATWGNWLQYWLFSSYPVAVAIMPYVDHLQPFNPSTEYHRILTFPREDDIYTQAVPLMLSDLFIYDYLLEDNDRGRGGNFFLDGRTNLLFWDSGMAFSHGPGVKFSSIDILCGPERWRKMSRDPDRTYCTAICKFRNSTIQNLINVGPTKQEQKLSNQLRKILDKSVFDYVSYFTQQFVRFPKMQYQTGDFFTGFDHKISNLLGHVNSCIEEFGEEAVLVEYSKA